jgi:hypothetical protein
VDDVLFGQCLTAKNMSCHGKAMANRKSENDGNYGFCIFFSNLF